MVFIDPLPLPIKKGRFTRTQRRELAQIARSNRQLGGRVIVIYPGQDIQTAINKLATSNGGTLLLKTGTHVVSTALTGLSFVQIVGENQISTILDFNSGSANFSFTGTNIYTTGTISGVANGVTVTGSGTAWTTNITTDHQIFLAQRWYRIASITSDTELVLSEGYQGGASFPGASYRAVKVKEDIEFNELTLKDSTGTAIDFTDCRNIIMENISVVGSGKGIVFTQVSEIAMDASLINTCTGDGITLDDCGLVDIESTTSTANTGSAHGYKINDCRTMTIAASAADSNAGDGFNITGSSIINLVGISGSVNTGQGIEIVSTSNDIFIHDAYCDGNTSDGLKLTATADRVIVTGGFFTNNGGGGINVAASDCDNSVISGCVFSGNTGDAVIDLGIGTSIDGSNVGTDLNMVKEYRRMKNTSGGELVAGDVVILKAVAAGDEVTTTTTQGDDTVFAMAVETIANNAYGRFQTLGKTTVLKVDGTTDIAVGDHIGTFTTAKIGMKAASGDMSFAVALEGYTTDDSAGVIDAVLITKRKI